MINGFLSAAGLTIVLAILAPERAYAQSTANYSAPNMWGIVSGGVSVPGALDSAATHNQDSAAAAAVNAAKRGILVGSGGSSIIEAIGSQTIVSVTITGNNNSSSITANQSSSNTGDVTNKGQLGKTITGNNN